jgi:hypothetical protein
MDNKFHSPTPRINAVEHLPAEIDPSIDSVVKAFAQNEGRIWDTINVLHIVAIHGARFGQAYCKALFARFGRPFPLTTDPHDKTVSDVWDQIYLHGAHLPGESEPNVVRSTGINPDRIFDKSNFHFYEEASVMAIFESQLVNAWTMFETLAADLWKASVNSFPSPLANLTGNSDRIAEMTGLSEENKREEQSPDEMQSLDTGEDDQEYSGKSVPLGKIQQITLGTYDLSGKMGTLWFESEKVKFTSLKGIRSAYSSSFSEKYSIRSSQIDKALSDTRLEALTER